MSESNLTESQIRRLQELLLSFVNEGAGVALVAGSCIGVGIEWLIRGGVADDDIRKAITPLIATIRMHIVDNTPDAEIFAKYGIKRSD